MTKIKLAEYIAIAALALTGVAAYSQIKSDIAVTKRENLIFSQELKEVERRLNNRLERIETKVDILIIKQEL